MAPMTAIESLASAIVFGAGGAIGRSLVTRLVSSGNFATVHAGSRSATTLPNGAVPFYFDFDDESSIAQAVVSLPNPPGLVMIATGILHAPDRGITPEKGLRAIDPAVMAALYRVNAIGPAMIVKHLVPRLPRGIPVRIGILSAKVGSIGDNRLGGWHSYRASKAALNMLVRNFAIELARSHPQAIIAALHPGTVASALSAPFQRAVPADRLFEPDRAAEHLLKVLQALTPADSGGLFSWQGQRLPD